MKALITLIVEFDDEFVISEALRHGRPPEVIAKEIAGDLECRTVDCCRWRDGVEPGGVSSRIDLQSTESQV